MQSHNKEAMRMVMKLSTHSFTLTSPAEVAGMRCGCSEERSPEVCDSEDVDGDIENLENHARVEVFLNRLF